MGCCDGCCEAIARYGVRFTNLLIAIFGVLITIWGIIITSKIDKANAFAIFVLVIGGYAILVGLFGIWVSFNRYAQSTVCCYLVMLGIAVFAQLCMGIAYSVDDNVINDAIDTGCGAKQAPHGLKPCSNTTTPTYDSCTPTPKNATTNTTTCYCTCDSGCRSCKSNAQDARNFVNDHGDVINILFYIGAGVEAAALLSAWCKKANARDKEAEDRLLDDYDDPLANAKKKQTALPLNDPGREEHESTKAWRAKMQEKYGDLAAKSGKSFERK